MYVTVPLMISVPFWMKTSPAITLPPGVRFASMVAIAPVPLSLQASVLASPVSPRTAHAGGACSSSCCIVSRLAGRSARRLRGMITFWPPTTIVASDHTSCGSLTVSRSTSPASRAVTGRTAAPAGCAWTTAENTHSAAHARPTHDRNADHRPHVSNVDDIRVRGPVIEVMARDSARAQRAVAGAFAHVSVQLPDESACWNRLSMVRGPSDRVATDARQLRLRDVSQGLRLRHRLEPLERVVLDLAYALACHVEGATHLVERARPAPGEAEAHFEDLPRAVGQHSQRTAHIVAAQGVTDLLVRRLGRVVLDEVAELGPVLVADRLLQRDRLLGHAQDVAHLAHRAVELGGDLLRGGLAAQRLDETALHVDDLVQALDHVHGDADRAALVGDRAGHGLADPPRGVRRELVAAAVVELLDRADEPERALLDQIEEGQPAAEVALGDRDDEAQVGLDHALLGGHVAALDALGQRDLLGAREQRHLADR